MVTEIRVTTDAINEDFSAAGMEFSRRELGQIGRTQLLEYIIKLEAVEVPDTLRKPPQLILKSRWGNFKVLKKKGQLYATNIDLPHEPDVQLSPKKTLDFVAGEEIQEVEHVEAPAKKKKGQKPGSEIDYSEVPFWARHFSKAIVILAVSTITVAAFILTSEPSDLMPPATHEYITDPVQIKALESRYKGVYLTGDKPGDLAIYLNGAGQIELSEFVLVKEVNEAFLKLEERNTYAYATKDGLTFAILGGVEPITLVSKDKLSFYGDVYERVGDDYGDLPMWDEAQ